MASKRNIRRRQCGHKKRFTSSELAKDAMYALIRKGLHRSGFLHVYYCTFCNGYHFGHSMGR